MDESVRLLLVDNQVDAREWLAEWLRRNDNFHVDTADDGAQCLEKVAAAEGNYDVIVMDLVLGNGPDGIDTIKEVRQRYSGIETIIITGFGDRRDGMRAIKAGAYKYVLKPFEKDELVVYIRHAAERRKLLHEVSRAKIYETFTALRMGLGLTDILERIVDNLHGLFNLTTCTVMLIDRRQTRLQVAAEKGLGTKVVRLIADLPKDMKKVFVNDAPLEITNLDERPDWQLSLVRSDLKSFTLLPLKNRTGEPLGVITMGRTSQTVPSSEDEKRLLMGIADQAAIAIENARLHEGIKNRAVLLEMLDLASLEIVDPTEVDQVLRKTIERATELLKASGGAVYLFISTTENEHLEVRASFGEPSIPEGTIVDKERGVVGRVVKTKRPFAKSNYFEWSDRQHLFDSLGLRAVIGVPITSGDNLLGVLALHHTEEGKEFSHNQQTILVSFGKHAGAALEKAQTLDEQLKTGNLIEALVSELDDDRLMDKILDLLKDYYPDSCCEILLKDESSNELRVAASNFPDGVDRVTPIKLSKSKGITAWVASTGRSKIIRDVRKEKLYIPVRSETRSEIAVALAAGSKVMGVLNVESTRVAAFTERDERVLTRLAAAMGAQVNQAQRIDVAKRKMEQSQILAEFSSAIIAAPDVKDKLEILSKKLLEISQADFSVLSLLTRDGYHLRVRAAHAANPNEKWRPGIGKLCELLSIRHLAEEVLGASHKVYKAGDPFGDRLLQSLSDHISLNQKLQSVLLIPIKEGANFAGLCILGELPGLNTAVFTDRRIGEAVSIADSAAPFIQQARNLELERGRGEVLKHLMKVGSTVTATLDQKSVFNLIDEYCLKLLNAEISTTFLVRRPGFLSLVSNSGSPDSAAIIGLELEIRAGKGLTGHIAHEGRVFNQYGEELLRHPAIKSRGPHPHLPSGYCSSILAVPLKKVVDGKEQLIGLLKVENKKDQTGKVDPTRGFNEEDVLVLQTLASFAVTAIQNAEYFGFATAMQRVAEVVNSSIEDYSGVLERVLSELRQIIPFDTASIQLLSGNVLKVKACQWFDEDEKQDVLKLSFPLIPRFPNEQVIRSKKPYLINDVRATDYEHFWKERMYCSSHIRSWLGVPLMHGDETIGMMSIESHSCSFYTSTHVEQAVAFANQVVPAIVNAQMYRSSECLIGLVEDLTKHLKRDTVLQKIAYDALDKTAIIGADKAIIYEYDADRATFNTAVYAGELLRPEMSNPPFSSDSIVYRCTGLKDCHLAKDVTKCKVLGGRFTRREGIASAAVFPLLLDEQLVGLMFINYVTPHDFTNQEVRVMELFARHAAIAIENARKYDIVNKRMEVASAAARIGRLASIWAHDVQAPTFRVRLLVDMLRPRLKDRFNEELLEKIYKANSQIAEIIPGLPDRHEKEKVDLKEIIEEVKSRKVKDLQQRNVELKIDLNGTPPIFGNSRWMVWILNNLFNNALRFMPDGGTISVSSRLSNKRLLLEVADSGPGLTESVRNQLFIGKVVDPQSNGRGWALLLIKDVLNEYDADLVLPSKDESPSGFILDLPLALDQEGQNE